MSVDDRDRSTEMFADKTQMVDIYMDAVQLDTGTTKGVK